MSTQPDAPPSPAEAPTVDLGSAGSGGSIGSIGSGDTADDRDSFDEILKQVVQPRGAVDTLAIGSELVGRFLITRVLGEGGMGTVYMARDATLGREVAIKVHHAAGGAQRLRREAVAMARLAHPNVVTVFEVGDLAGRPFVVMEYITGTTLRAWLAAAPRSVRDILAMLIAAGEGLAAAHDAGLVHRDFKPENVLLGVDGRPRVGDFGLARELDSRDEVPAQPSASVEDLRTPVTQTGAVLGTPAYMSPEQFTGDPVDARADQFAFCVTAWEALWNQRPFAGTSFAQLQVAITLGERRPPPAEPRVPARVRLALERGLAVSPAERFPSMHGLIEAMRPGARRRGRGLVAGAAAAIVATTAVAIAVWPAGPTCDAAGIAELAAMRSDLPRLILAQGAPSLAVHATLVQQRYVRKFRSDAHAACEAGRAREWSPHIVANSRACFAGVARTAALLLADLDPAKPMDVVRHLRRLPPEEHCRNQTHLASRPPLPSDPQQQDALIEANATLAVAFDSVDDHDFVQLRRALDALEASPARSDPGVAAGMVILRAWLALDAGQTAEAHKLLVDAYYAARAIDDERISSVALVHLIDRREQLGLDRATTQEWLRTALADADRVRVRSPWLAGRVYVVAAHAADLAGDAATALTFVARARDVLEPGDPTWIDSFATEGAVRMWSGQVDDGIKAYEAALAQTIAYFGALDPEVAMLLSDHAASLLEVARVEPALAVARRAARIIDNVADPDDDRIDPIRVNLAAVLINTDHDDEALGLLVTARANNVRRLGETNTIVAHIDSNLAIIYNRRGQHDRAIAALKASLAITEKLVGADHTEVADVLYNLAASYRFKRDYPAAIAAARRGAAIYGARRPGSDRHRLALVMAASNANDAGDAHQALELTTTVLGFAEPDESAQTRAWVQLERALALIALRRPEDARPLLVRARADYAALQMTERVEQCDGLLARLPRAAGTR